MLKIENLHASIEGKEILKGINLEVNEGEIHAIMGPNGSGKSTLAAVIVGREYVEINKGRILYDDEDITALSPEERALKGVFLSFQYPVEIPGVSMVNFLRAAINEKRKFLGQEAIAPSDFLRILREKKKLVNIDSALTNRSVNEGFSGGEKKKNEIFQMAMLEPRLAILDETDSGLDIDALRTVADGVNALKRPDNATIVITHYQRLLNYIIPDYVHVLLRGKILLTSGKELAMELEEKGYDWLNEENGNGGY